MNDEKEVSRNVKNLVDFPRKIQVQGVAFESSGSGALRLVT